MHYQAVPNALDIHALAANRDDRLAGGAGTA